MFFSDLALRRQNVSLLPDYDAVILDECHTLESVAGDHLGMRMTSGQFDYLFDRLYNDRTHKGLLVENELVALQQMVDRCPVCIESVLCRSLGLVGRIRTSQRQSELTWCRFEFSQ